jgi:SNF2 family DNA or RNA helicase
MTQAHKIPIKMKSSVQMIEEFQKKEKIPLLLKSQHSKWHAIKFTQTLYEFQAEVVTWMSQIVSGILGVGMGLGKTIMVIKTICDKQYNRVVIVMPPFLLTQWRQEIMKFSDLRSEEIVIYHGPQRNKLRHDLAQSRIVLTSFGVIQSDIMDQESLLFEYHINEKFDCLIIDEAHQLRNDKTIVYDRCLRLACKIPAKWLLSGTIIHNSIKDFMSLATIVDADNWEKVKSDTELLNQWKDQYYYHLMKEECEVPLPEKHIYERFLEFDSNHMDEYLQILTEVKEVYKNYQTKQTAVNYQCLLAKILRLRQCCNHPNASLSTDDLKDEKNIYINPSCAKFEEIADICSQSNIDDKIVIFSQWTGTIHLIAKYLATKRISCIRYGGDLSLNDKNGIIDQFNHSSVKVLLITTKAGGVGLNLTKANHVILVDSWWNYAVEEQAIDRVYRIGQSKDVFVHRLYMEDTIEKWMIALKMKKQAINDKFHDKILGESEEISLPFLKQLLHNFI